MKMLLLAFLLVGLLLAGCTAPGTSSNGPTITVTGQASQTVAPDQVDIALTITSNGTTAMDSQTNNAAATAQVKNALLASGLNESDLSTTSYYTYGAYDPSCSSCPPPPQPVPYEGGMGSSGTVNAGEAQAPTATGGAASGSAVTGAASSSMISPGFPAPVIMPYWCPYKNNCPVIGYQTVHSIQIQSNQTQEGGTFADVALNAANGTSVNSVYFALTDSTQSQIENELQAQAATDAQTKARGIAAGLGASLGPIVSVNPQNVYPGPMPVYASAGSANAAAPAAPPTQFFPTSTTMSSSITVVYQLVQ